MEQKDWYNSLELMQNLLKKKHEELERHNKDIEEIECCIEAYKVKVGDYVPPKEDLKDSSNA